MNETKDTQVQAEDQEAAAHESSVGSPGMGTPQEVVARYSHCPICNANLHFTHVTDFLRNLTQETARCPECGVKARQAMHRLQ